MREHELYMRLCVRLAWTKREERTRRRKDAAKTGRRNVRSAVDVERHAVD